MRRLIQMIILRPRRMKVGSGFLSIKTEEITEQNLMIADLSARIYGAGVERSDT